MRRELALMFGLTGCVGGMRDDLRAVEHATSSPIAPVDEPVDSETPPEARKELGKPLDADAAVRVALLANRDLRATLRDMGVSRGRVVQAGALPNPIVELEILPERTSNFELRVEYDVTGLILAPIRQNAQAPDLDVARYRAAGAVIDTGRRARAAFYRALAAAEKLTLAKRSLDALAADQDAAHALSEAGNMTDLDLASHDAAFEEARADVAEMELSAADAREALVRTLGLHGSETEVTLAGTLPALPETLTPVEDLEARAVRASFDLKARKRELEGLGRTAGLARTEGWLPDVAADVHALQGVRDPISGAVQSQQWDVSAGVRLSVPLFDQKRGTAAALDAQLGAAVERYVGAAIDLRSRARALYARLVTAHARARQYQTKILPARKRVSEQALLQYNAMQLGVFQLLTARREELAAELAGVDALATYWVTRAAFDALLAGAPAGGNDDPSP